MHSSLLLVSALAAGAFARPHPGNLPRKLYTQTELKTLTVIATATPGAPSACVPKRPTSTPTGTSITVPISQAPAPSMARPSADVISKANKPKKDPKSSKGDGKASQTGTGSGSGTGTGTGTGSGTGSQNNQSTKPSTSTAAASTPSAGSGTGSGSSSGSGSNTGTSSGASSSRVTGAEQANLSSGADYQAAVLYHHNAARANHNADALTWDSACEENARIAAEKCDFEHYIPDGVSQGQNLYATGGNSFNVTGGITEGWYKGEFEAMLPYFGQADIPSGAFMEVGHLTQMVWKTTTKVGCVSIDCGGKMTINGASSSIDKYTVCNYSPPGNYMGEYGNNVNPPVSKTDLGSWTD